MTCYDHHIKKGTPAFITSAKREREREREIGETFLKVLLEFRSRMRLVLADFGLARLYNVPLKAVSGRVEFPTVSNVRQWKLDRCWSTGGVCGWPHDNGLMTMVWDVLILIQDSSLAPMFRSFAGLYPRHRDAVVPATRDSAGPGAVWSQHRHLVFELHLRRNGHSSCPLHRWLWDLASQYAACQLGLILKNIAALRRLIRSSRSFESSEPLTKRPRILYYTILYNTIQ